MAMFSWNFWNKQFSRNNIKIKLINTFLDKIISEFNNQTISILINYYYYYYHQYNNQIYSNFYNVPEHPSFSTKGKSNENNFILD